MIQRTFNGAYLLQSGASWLANDLWLLAYMHTPDILLSDSNSHINLLNAALRRLRVAAQAAAAGGCLPLQLSEPFGAF